MRGNVISGIETCQAFAIGAIRYAKDGRRAFINEDLNRIAHGAQFYMVPFARGEAKSGSASWNNRASGRVNQTQGAVCPFETIAIRSGAVTANIRANNAAIVRRARHKAITAICPGGIAKEGRLG